MSRRPDERKRVNGPHWIESIGYWRITCIDPEQDQPKDRRRNLHFRERAEADVAKQQVEQKYARLEGLTIEAALAEYKVHMAEKGDKPGTCDETCRRLALFFGDGDKQLSRIDEAKADALYRAFAESGYEVGPAKARRWKPYSPAFHRNVLAQAKTFLRWCVKPRGWLRSNPLEAVQGIGARTVGKEQLTGDEARKFYEWCAFKARRGDEAALALIMLLLMALRQGDAFTRVVRDVDLDGTVLRIGVGSSARSKTKKGDRPRRIPVILQPMIRALVEGRSPLEPLFKAADGGFHTKSWLLAAARRFCKQAGVPYVCPHGLKGTAATLASDSGALADQVAEYLQHESKSTSEQHYIARGASDEAATGRALRVIVGGAG